MRDIIFTQLWAEALVAVVSMHLPVCAHTRLARLVLVQEGVHDVAPLHPGQARATRFFRPRS